MLNIATVVALFAVSTGDLCEEPIPAAGDEPAYCPITESQRIETPKFSFVAEPGTEVGIDWGRSRVFVRSSDSQHEADLVISAFPVERYSGLLNAIGRCAVVSDTSLGLVACDQSKGRIIFITYLIQGQKSVVGVDFSAVPTTIDVVPRFEKMIKSIEVD